MISFHWKLWLCWLGNCVRETQLWHNLRPSYIKPGPVSVWVKTLYAAVDFDYRVGDIYKYLYTSLNFWCSFSAVNFLVSVSNFLKINFVGLLSVLKTVFEYQYITNLFIFPLDYKISNFSQWIKFTYYSTTKIFNY